MAKKLIYKSTGHEIKGMVVSKTGGIAKISMDNGGVMFLPETAIAEVVEKETKKQAKKAYKKENNTDVVESEE